VAPVRWLSQGEPHLPDGLGWLSARETERVERMAFTKRRVEFLLGRWTAKQAIARTHGLPSDQASLARIEVLHAPDGAPVPHLGGEPLLRRVSLTDRAGWAVCVVSPGGSEVGCDLELVEPRSPAFVRDYLTAGEAAVVEAAGPDRDLLANLVWSAKESALKVLRTGLRRDTRSVEVNLDGRAPDGGWSRLRVRAEEGREFAGWWARFGPFLLTVAAADEIPAPDPIDDPPALAGAGPIHSWLASPRRHDPLAGGR
jgi:4'-phosphopantetheinyl transferase